MLGGAAHHDRAAPQAIGRVNAGAAQDHAAGGEIRARHEFHQLFDRKTGVVDQRHRGVDHFAEIVRRDVGRHADGDALRAVDEEIGEARRQHDRLAPAAVVVGLVIDGFLVVVLEQRIGGMREARLGVAHRRGGIAVHRAVIALARRPRARAWRSPAPCAPSRHRSRHRRADGSCPSLRRRCAPTCGRRGSSRSPHPSWHRGCGGAPASSRRAHRAARAKRSRSSRNRGRSVSSPLRSRRALCPRAAVRRAGRPRRVQSKRNAGQNACVEMTKTLADCGLFHKPRAVVTIRRGRPLINTLSGVSERLSQAARGRRAGPSASPLFGTAQKAAHWLRSTDLPARPNWFRSVILPGRNWVRSGESPRAKIGFVR